MTSEEEKEIRKEFQDFADSIIWSNDDGSEKYIGVGNMADWWMNKIQQTEQRLLSKLREKLKLKQQAGHLVLSEHHVYDEAFDDVFELLSEFEVKE